MGRSGRGGGRSGRGGGGSVERDVRNEEEAKEYCAGWAALSLLLALVFLEGILHPPIFHPDWPE